MFDSSAISPGQCATLTLTATKDAPAASSFSVTVTAARVSDGAVRTAEFLLTVTRIALGGGDINYTLDNANGLFPSASQTCFVDFMNFLAPLRDTLFGMPDTPNLTVTVKIDPTVGEGGFRPLTDEMLLVRAPTCQSDTSITLGVVGHEDGHAAHRTYLRLTQRFPGALESFREEGGANALAVLESTWAREQGWLAGALHEDAVLDIHLLNRIPPELVAAPGESSHPDDVLNSLWMHAATGTHLMALFANLTGPAMNISQWDSMLKRWNEARYDFVNREQRLPTAAEDDQLFAGSGVSPNDIDGKQPIAWFAEQVIAEPLANLQAGTYADLLMRPSINPQFVDVPIIIRDSAGGESAVTAGSATFRVLTKDLGTEICRDTFDLAQVHEYPFVCNDAQGNPVQLGEDVYVAKVETTIAGQDYSTMTYFVVLSANGKTVSGWPGIYVITTDGSGAVVDAQVTALEGSEQPLAPGLFLATPTDTTVLPLQVVLQANTAAGTATSTFTVPPLKWWTTVGIMELQ